MGLLPSVIACLPVARGPNGGREIFRITTSSPRKIHCLKVRLGPFTGLLSNHSRAEIAIYFRLNLQLIFGYVLYVL
jgi:hypothetical protein